MADLIIQQLGTLLGTMAYKGVPEEIQDKLVDVIEAYSKYTKEKAVSDG